MDNNENGKNTLEAIPVEGTLTAAKATMIFQTCACRHALN